MAPDGSWVAAGGWDTPRGPSGATCLIFDTATGAVAARLGPFANVINHLAVSADGSYLAVLVGSEGLRVWERTSADARQWQVLATDRDYGGKMAYGAAFDRRGTLYTVGYDRKLRRYQAPYGGKPLSVLTKGGSEPHSVEVHPSGDRVAVGFVDNAGVDIYDAPTLAWRAAANVKGVDNGNVGSVAWSADGNRLYAAGRYVKAARLPFASGIAPVSAPRATSPAP